MPFYKGLVGLLLYFHKGPVRLSSSMRLQGGRRVTLESNAQLELFPENKPAHFRICLPEMWSLDRTWEVGLFQLLLPHTWRNVLTRQVGMHLHYSSLNPDVRVFLWAGTYVMVQDVVEGWLQRQRARERRRPRIDGGLGRARFLQVDLSQRRVLHLSASLAGMGVGLPGL